MGGEGDRPQRMEQRMTTMENILKEIKEQMNNMSKKANTIENKITEQGVMLNKIEELYEGYRKMKGEIETLKADNIQVKRKLYEIERKMEKEEIIQKRNVIEIYGIPEKINEDINEIITKLAKHAKSEIREDEIENSYRAKAVEGREKPITVKFRTKEIRDKLIKAMKNHKPRLGNIGIEPENKKIFINEALIPQRKRLLYMAKQEARNRNWNRVWTYSGAIYVIIEENRRNIKLESEEDLEKLIK